MAESLSLLLPPEHAGIDHWTRGSATIRPLTFYDYRWNQLSEIIRTDEPVRRDARAAESTLGQARIDGLRWRRYHLLRWANGLSRESPVARCCWPPP
jgi:hypothetical protein